MPVAQSYKFNFKTRKVTDENGKEVGRSTGETKKDSIAALLKKSMM